MADGFFHGADKAKDIEKRLFSALEQALSHGAHDFRYPSLITHGFEYPQARTVVLRAVDKTHKKLYFYTDRRSDKVQQIKQSPKVGLHFYHREKKMQLRLGGELSVFYSGALWDKHFQSLPTSRYSEYSTILAPGENIENPEAPYAVQTDLARENFALLQFSVEKMEVLQLNGDHHYRIQFNYRGREFTSAWLQP